MISPEVQRVAIADYAASRGYDVAGWLEGIDESGSRARSAWWPRLDQAVAAIEAGEYEVLLVWKFSRVARHRLRWAVAIDRVEEAGGRIESATEQVDTTTSTGRFTRGMLAELQAFEAERIGEVWREVHARRVSSGRPANGKPRYGYTYDRDRKVHAPDPVTGPVLAELYRRYIAGESVYTLVRWLNGHGWRTTNSGQWSDRSLRRVLDSGFASGQFRVDGQLHDGVHEPLIDAETWQQYLDARAVRRGRPPRSERSHYLLSGLVRCARCGHPMVAGQFGAAMEPKYRCKTGKEQGPEACRGGYVMQSYLVDHVLAYLRDCAADIDAASSWVEAPPTHRAVLQVESETVAREMVRTDEALSRLAVNHASDPLPDHVYQQARTELLEQARRLHASHESLQRDLRRAVDDRAEVARDLLASWDHRLVTVRREILRSLIDCVLVTTGRPRAQLRVVEPSEVRPVP